jgi:hypothetical protein
MLHESSGLALQLYRSIHNKFGNRVRDRGLFLLPERVHPSEVSFYPFFVFLIPETQGLDACRRSRLKRSGRGETETRLDWRVPA